MSFLRKRESTTKQLPPKAVSSDQVAADVERVKKLLGPALIISPSHEALLPNVPPANIEAMARAAAQ